MTRGKPAWSQVKLRVCWGDVPEIGDELRMPTGRRYQVLDVRGRALRVLVLPPEAEVQGRVIDWQWAKRERRKHAERRCA